jgi:hypothetical protein
MTQKHRGSASATHEGSPSAPALWSAFVEQTGALWLSAYDQSAKAVSEMAAAQAKVCSDGFCAGVGQLTDPTLGRTILKTEMLVAKGQAERVADAVRQTIGGLIPELTPEEACRALPD